MEKTTQIAEALVNSGALKFGTFKLKSGQTSPFYIDLACLLSSPADFLRIVDAVVNKVIEISSSTKIDKLASIELKGALLLPSVAARLNLPSVVVRKKTKEYGATGRITGGEIRKGERILFIDDVVSDGSSKLEGIKPLLDEGAEVQTILVVFDREQGGRQKLEKLGYQFHAVARLSEVVHGLIGEGKISREKAEIVLNYITK